MVRRLKVRTPQGGRGPDLLEVATSPDESPVRQAPDENDHPSYPNHLPMIPSPEMQPQTGPSDTQQQQHKQKQKQKQPEQRWQPDSQQEPRQQQHQQEDKEEADKWTPSVKQPKLRREFSSEKDDIDVPEDFPRMFAEKLGVWVEQCLIEREVLVQTEVRWLRAERQRLEAKLGGLEAGSIAPTPADVLVRSQRMGEKSVAVIPRDWDPVASCQSFLPLQYGRAEDLDMRIVPVRLPTEPADEELDVPRDDHVMGMKSGKSSEAVKAIKRQFTDTFGTHTHWNRDESLIESTPEEVRIERTKMLFKGMEMLVLLVSVISAVTAGLEADIEWRGWLVINGLLLVVFWAEIIIKIYVLSARTYFMGPERPWNIFDFAITSLSFLDWINSVVQSTGLPIINPVPLRVLRVVRLARFVRGSLFKDLNALIYGFLYGLRPLFLAIFLLLIVSYSLGLVMRMSVGEEEGEKYVLGRKYFGDVRLAMFNVFRCLKSDCTTEEGWPLVLRIGDNYGWWPKVLYSVIILVISLGLLNVVLALFVERVLEGAKYSESMRNRMEAKEAHFLRTIRDHLGFVDDLAEEYYGLHPEDLTDEEYLTVSKGFFAVLLHKHRFVDVLHRMGIRLEDLDVTESDLFEILSPDGMPLAFDNLLQEISMMRGEARVTLQILSLSVQNKTLRLVQRLCDKFNVKHNDFLHASQVPRRTQCNSGMVYVRGLTRTIALEVGVAMKETE